MQLFKVDTWKDFLIHLGIIAVTGIALVLLFFYVYLPFDTNHGETITVPDVQGMALKELDDFLGERNLRYEVTEDSSFSPTAPPLAVLKQFPLPESKVKEHRKIYVTLNAEKPPLIRMPNLVGGSVKNALLVLKSYDLIHGKTRYISDPFLNSVRGQQLNGREVLEGERIPKGSVIDIVAGNGLGNQNLQSPNLGGLDYESAYFAIVGSGLKIGTVTYEKEGVVVMEVMNNDESLRHIKKQVSPGAVFKQNPARGEDMRLGQTVDLWIYSPDSLNTGTTLLDQE